MVSRKLTQQIDGPKAPQWWQKIQWITNPLDYMDAAQKQYGDIFNAPVIGNHPYVLFVSHPQALQQIFTNDTKQFITPPNHFLQPIVGSNSIFILEGNRHRRERKLLLPPFHGERIHTYGQLICNLTDQIMQQVHPGQIFVARSLAQEISLDVILKAVFGIYAPERFLERQFSSYEFFPFGGGIRRCIGEVLALFEMKLVVAKIVSQYQLTLAQQQPERPQRRGATLAPSTGVKLIMQGIKRI